jgi:hypothetical protein
MALLAGLSRPKIGPAVRHVPQGMSNADKADL